MKKLATAVVAALSLGVASATVGAAPADAAPSTRARVGSTSLVDVLAADGTSLDSNWNDFDILEQAVLAVLKAKPDSPVGVLADGGTRLTAFLPTDRAFRRLATDLSGTRPATEAATLQGLVDIAGVDTIETVLLYHVVPGKTLASPTILAAAGRGDKVTTAQGGTVKVHVIKGALTLLDKDDDATNPKAVTALLDVNRGNKQIGHGIDRVLRPVNL